MTNEEFIKLCKDNGISDVQLAINSSYETVIKTINDQIDKKDIVDIKTYIIKATYNDNTVSISSEYLSEDLISMIKESAMYTENKTKDELLKPIQLDTDSTFVKESIDEFESVLLEVNKIREKEFKYNKSILQEICYDVNKKEIINSDGLNISSASAKYTYVIESASNNGGESVTDYKCIVKKNKEDLDIIKYAKEVMKNNELHLSEKTIKSGNYDLLLYPSVTNNLVSYLISIIDGNKINKDVSYLKGKLNKKVFSDKLTIIEDASAINSTSYRPFDDEGNKTEKKEIVKNGVLKTYLFDNKNAKEANTNSTGNSYGGKIQCRNVYIEPGTSTLEDMIKKMKNGIIVMDILISSSALNATTGVFPGQIFSGLLVENGKVKHAVKNAIFTTDLSELFSNIVDIGRELENCDSVISTPAILVENINITGDNSEN